MPVTTYKSDVDTGPPEYSKEVADLWEEFQTFTEQTYAVEERKIYTERWLCDDLVEYRFDLLCHVHGPEWQIMGCVSTESELLAYMYGAINAGANRKESE